MLDLSIYRTYKEVCFWSGKLKYNKKSLEGTSGSKDSVGYTEMWYDGKNIRFSLWTQKKNHHDKLFKEVLAWYYNYYHLFFVLVTPSVSRSEGCLLSRGNEYPE